mgnify:CR=1 FL=1
MLALVVAPIFSGTDTLDKPPQIPISDSDWQSTPVAVQALVISLLHGMERVGHLEQVVEQAARIASLKTELARRKGRSLSTGPSASAP